MLHRFLGLDESKVPRMATDLLARQLPNGGWSIWYGDGGELSATVEAYMGLKIAGLSPMTKNGASPPVYSGPGRAA